MSDTNASFEADKPIFEALLTPHRSLGRTGFLILMGALIFGWAVTGAIFLAHGAWPVFGFFGLDVIGVYVAFRINYRAARAREEISVSRTRLDIRKTAPSGRAGDRQGALNPAFQNRQRNSLPTLREASFGWLRSAGRPIFAVNEILPWEILP
ncbi:MAG: DUF2244 domain-containing protein [Mesorhizobium sp.]|nr:MAG: DUF2244 domain-containing protein [Mesorhizobium sp.]